MKNIREVDWSKYLMAFLITAIVFGGAFFVSDSLNDRRVNEVQSIQERISLDILTSETQFDLLQEIPCRAIDNTVLSEELNSLASRMSHTESLLGKDNAEVIQLKKAYFLLEAKDYLLAKRIDRACDTNPVIVLYFYSSKAQCDDCQKQGVVLTKLREKYPDLRVYSFDYHFDYQIVKTLISMFDIEDSLPALVIDSEVTYGYRNLEELEEQFPSISKLPTKQDLIPIIEEETTD
jgi:thiol-disulfide isomerase/thioredoxin